MLLQRLRLQNYKQYVALDLVFREGLVGIIGRNGAGKSTLFDAILYCLYGREDVNKSLIRSSFADAKATVSLELEFFVGEHLYRVRREFRGRALTPYAELFKNDMRIAHTPAAVNTEVTKVLHLERDAFKRSVFARQKELDDLTKATREERRKLVRRMLGLERLDEMQAAINADARDGKNRILGQTQALLSEAERQRIEAEIEQGEQLLAQKRVELEKEQALLEAVNKQYQAIKARFDAAQQRLSRFNELAQAIEKMRERVEQWQHQKQQLAQKIAQLQQLRRQLEAQRPAFEALKKRREQLEELEEEYQKFVNYRARAERLAQAQQELERARRQVELRTAKVERLPAVAVALEQKSRELLRVQRDIEVALDQHSSVRGELNALQTRLRERTEQLRQLRALGRSSHCPTCMQPLLDGYDRALSALEGEIKQLEAIRIRALEAQLTAISERGRVLRQREQALKEEEDALRKERLQLDEDARQKGLWEKECRKWEEHIAAEEAILRVIGKVSFDEAHYQQFRQRVKEEEGAFLEFINNENRLGRDLPQAMREHQEAEENAGAAQRELETLLEAQQAVGHNPEEYETARYALTSFADTLREHNERVQRAGKECLEQENQVERARERLQRDAQLREQIQAQQLDIEQLEQLSALVGQFKGEILTRVGPSISREASTLFSRITRGRYENIRVDEDFDFSISDGGAFYPIERFSGGEVDLANLCLRIAITKAIFDLSGAAHTAGFLAFDEVLGSQDEERRMEIMQAFHYLKEQFRQIYVVSHIESLKDFFPNLLEVSVGPGGSAAVWR